jgi:peptidoglycan/xylan/chitin deacetylase (PgdA/CDA1 family)
MILMYHHVCPREMTPPALRQSQLEGWQFNIEPEDFDGQLIYLRRRGFFFVPLEEYVAELGTGRINRQRLVAVTFDDGWRDNFEYALPVLLSHSVPATFFVVSGEMPGVDHSRRMTTDQLRLLNQSGMTIGAHSKTHPNLATLSPERLLEEIHGCKSELEHACSSTVKFFAYPGGRFSPLVVEACRDAGFQAACSVISWGFNNEQSRYWLYRDVLSSQCNALTDRLRTYYVFRSMFGWRARQALNKHLSTSTQNSST